MSVKQNKTISELNNEFIEFINNSILTEPFANCSAKDLYNVSAKDWFEIRSKNLYHQLLFGSQKDYLSKNTFLLMGLAIISSKIMNQLNNSTDHKKMKLLKSYLAELEESSPQELNHSQLKKSNLFYLDYKKCVGDDIDWDVQTVDYDSLKNCLVVRLRDYIDTIDDIRFKDFGSVKARASKMMTTPRVESPYFTVPAAAIYCGLSQNTIRNHRKIGKLVHDAGDEHQGYKFLKETLDKYIGKT